MASLQPHQALRLASLNILLILRRAGMVPGATSPPPGAHRHARRRRLRVRHPDAGLLADALQRRRLHPAGTPAEPRARHHVRLAPRLRRLRHLPRPPPPPPPAHDALHAPPGGGLRAGAVRVPRPLHGPRGRRGPAPLVPAGRRGDVPLHRAPRRRRRWWWAPRGGSVRGEPRPVRVPRVPGAVGRRHRRRVDPRDGSQGLLPRRRWRQPALPRRGQPAPRRGCRQPAVRMVLRPRDGVGARGLRVRVQNVHSWRWGGIRAAAGRGSWRRGRPPPRHEDTQL